MKYIHLFIAIFLFLGCEPGNEFLPSDEAVAVRLIPSLDDSAPGGTRVVDQNWQTRDIVGVSIDNGTATYNGTAYKQYKPTGTVPGTSVMLEPTNDATETLYYPVDGSNVAFRAFCPYTTITDNKVTYTFTNQRNSGEMQDVDLVYHQSATKAYNNKTSGTVPMTFKHQFSKVVINVTSGTNGPADLSNLKIALTNMPTQVTFDLSSGNVSTISAADDIIEPCHDNTGNAMAIVPPHTPTTGSKITFTIPNSNFNYSYDISDIAGLEFKGEHEYLFEFKLTQTAAVLTGTKIGEWGTGTIVWDGNNNWLTAPTEVIHYKEESTGNTIVIKTNHPAKPGIQYSTSATTVIGSVGWLTQTGFTQTKTTSPYEWTLNYSVAATSIDRDAYIHFSVGTMTVATKVRQSKESKPIPIPTPIYVDGNTNCFIVPPGSAIMFPLTRPVEAAVSVATPTSTFDVEKLWDDTMGGAVSRVLVTGDQGKAAHVTVVAGKNPGNALIAVKVGTTIVWSYHIWVTDYEPITGATFTNTRNNNNNGKHFVFMDRNLGATKAGRGSGYGTGLFYQWGRKDPFPATLAPAAIQLGGGSFTAVLTTADLGTVNNTIKNPSVFYHGDGFANSYDWHFGSRNNELWGHSGGKSVYDPCPAGWRVPKNSNMNEAGSPWAGFGIPGTNTPTNLDPAGFSSGYQWGTNAAYPAPGYRLYNAGELDTDFIGKRGYYATASPLLPTNPDYGMTFIFHNDNNNNYANRNIAIARAYGVSVRCVRE